MSHGSPQLPESPRFTEPARRRAGSALRSLAAFTAVGVTALGTTALLTSTAAAVSAAGAATPIAVAAPPNVGLFGAQDPTYDGVYRQSLAILGLIATGHTPNIPAVGWLLSQQCSDGAFTAYRANTSTACTPATEDENATAAAIEAMVALGKPTATAAAALRHFQLTDGGFYDNTAFGPAASDANSTGLALSALAAAGVDPATVKSTTGKTGDDYLRSLQIACSTTTGGGAYDFQGEKTLHANDYATVQALLGELGKAFPVSPTSAGSATSAAACPTAVSDAATSAAAAGSYLTTRLAATKGAIPSAFGSGTDWTTTANAVLDLEAAGAATTAVAPALTALEAGAKAYVHVSGAFAPGPLATLLLVAHASGIDPGSFGGVDLTTTLASTERVAAAVPPTATASPSPVATPVATLPATGTTDAMPLGVLAVLLVGLGTVAVLISRPGRRRVGQHGC